MAWNDEGLNMNYFKNIETWMIAGDAVVVITIVVVGCRMTGVIAKGIGVGMAGDAVLMGVALASRWENAAGGRVIWVRIGGLLGLFFWRHSSHAATYWQKFKIILRLENIFQNALI